MFCWREPSSRRSSLLVSRSESSTLAPGQTSWKTGAAGWRSGQRRRKASGVRLLRSHSRSGSCSPGLWSEPPSHRLQTTYTESFTSLFLNKAEPPQDALTLPAAKCSAASIRSTDSNGVQKRDQSPHLCVDYSPLNEHTIKDVFLLFTFIDHKQNTNN